MLLLITYCSCQFSEMDILTFECNIFDFDQNHKVSIKDIYTCNMSAYLQKHSIFTINLSFKIDMNDFLILIYNSFHLKQILTEGSLYNLVMKSSFSVLSMIRESFHIITIFGLMSDSYHISSNINLIFPINSNIKNSYNFSHFSSFIFDVMKKHVNIYYSTNETIFIIALFFLIPF